MKRFIADTYSSLDARFPLLVKLARYVVSGGTAAFVDLFLLFVLTSLAHIWYLASAIVAYIVAFGVSFTLQKYWTFRDRSSDRVRTQAAVYFFISGANLCINTGLVYIFVDVAHINYLLSQVIAAAIVACESYFAYQIFVFKKH